MNDTRRYVDTWIVILSIVIALTIMALFTMRLEDRITHLEDRVTVLEQNAPLP